ncbi:MAG TPA: type II secretion system F family protein, partial [Syntrophaceae bacterium]|nr:type II secretion system F family protein [Syntrophaceae bacterium]
FAESEPELSQEPAPEQPFRRAEKKVKGALVYPAVVVSVAIVVIAVILIFVIPVFQEMFAGMGQALPLPTQVVVNLSNFVKGNIIYMIVAGFLIGYAFKRFYRTEKGKQMVDRYLIRAPVFGPLLRKVAVARFTSTLSTMLKSGVPILDSLDIVARTAGNKVVEAALIKTKSAIKEGQPMSEPLAETEVFPPMVVQMIGVGEATGELDAMLSKIAEFYEEEVDAAVEALTSMLEPLLMVFLGGTIGGLVISMYLPIFSMAGAITG